MEECLEIDFGLDSNNTPSASDRYKNDSLRFEWWYWEEGFPWDIINCWWTEDDEAAADEE